MKNKARILISYATLCHKSPKGKSSIYREPYIPPNYTNPACSYVELVNETRPHTSFDFI